LSDEQYEVLAQAMAESMRAEDRLKTSGPPAQAEPQQ
jgi:hypothetical protein